MQIKIQIQIYKFKSTIEGICPTILPQHLLIEALMENIQLSLILIQVLELGRLIG